MLVFAGCTNAAGGSSGGGGTGGSTGGDDPRNVVVGTYNNVVIDGIEYTLTFYEGGFGFIKKASSGNMRAIMPDVPAEGGYFQWTLSGNTVIMHVVPYGSDSFTLDFSNSGGTKKLSNPKTVPAATYEWNEASKTLTFKGPGEIKSPSYYGYGYDEHGHELTPLGEELKNKAEKVVIQDGVTIIGSVSLYLLENLKSVTIPDSVAVIYEHAFQIYQSSLTVNLPDSTAVFCAFMGNTKLTNLIVGSGHKYYTFENGILYSKDKTKIFSAPAVSGTVSIPSTVTYISPLAFWGSLSLNSVIIPNSVTSIRDSVFAQCSLTSVTIPDSVVSIEAGAFNQCRELPSVVIPDSVKEIGNRAFYVCWKLASITVKATTPPKLGAEAFKGRLDVERKIYVPSTSVSAYKAAAGWSEYADIIEPIPAS